MQFSYQLMHGCHFPEVGELFNPDPSRSTRYVVTSVSRKPNPSNVLLFDVTVDLQPLDNG